MGGGGGRKTGKMMEIYKKIENRQVQSIFTEGGGHNWDKQGGRKGVGSRSHTDKIKQCLYDQGFLREHKKRIAPIRCNLLSNHKVAVFTSSPVVYCSCLKSDSVRFCCSVEYSVLFKPQTQAFFFEGLLQTIQFSHQPKTWLFIFKCKQHGLFLSHYSRIHLSHYIVSEGWITIRTQTPHGGHLHLMVKDLHSKM